MQAHSFNPRRVCAIPIGQRGRNQNQARFKLKRVYNDSF